MTIIIMIIIMIIIIIIMIIIYMYIQKKLKDRRVGEREKKNNIDIYLRHKGIQWKSQDCLIQRKCFQS